MLNISKITHSNALTGLPFNEVYCASKFAIEGACESLAVLLQHFNIQWVLMTTSPLLTEILKIKKYCSITVNLHEDNLSCIVLLLFSRLSLIECGPVNSDFLINLQKAELGDSSLQQVDGRTLSLYEKYLQHCSTVFQNAAQDTEDIVEVCSFSSLTHLKS